MVSNLRDTKLASEAFAARQYLKEDRPFFGICLGMQTLFESSEENPGVAGLGVLPGVVKRFPEAKGFAVPNINWSGVAPMLRPGLELEVDVLVRNWILSHLRSHCLR